MLLPIICVFLANKVHNHCCGIQDDDRRTFALCAGGHYSDLAILCSIKQGYSIDPDKTTIAFIMSQSLGISNADDSSESEHSTA